MSEKQRQAWEKKLLSQSKRGLLHILFSRTVITTVLLLMNFFLLFSLLFELFEGITLVFGGLAVATAVMLIVILNSDDDPAFKLTWCIAVAVLPLFGIVLYTIFRFDLGSRVYKKLLEKSISASTSCIPDSDELQKLIGQDDPDTAALARYLQHYAHAPVYANTNVRYFPLGEDKFGEMLRQMELAQKFIFLEYCIV